MNEFQEIMKRQNKTAIEVMNIAAHEVAVENMDTEDYETWEQGEKLRDAEIARLQQERDEYRKGYEAAQLFAETLPREIRVKYFIGGHDIIYSLINYAARLRLVESAARKLLAVCPSDCWTVDEMNALDEALKGETK